MNDKDGKLFQFYQLNEEGIRLYGVEKKKQLLTTLKWSMLGTAVGYISSSFIDIFAKRMDPIKKDYFKTFTLILTVGSLTMMGYQISINEFKKVQAEICEKHGKKVNENSI